ncbi:MAG: beta-L-arabinofuranosidase domain-containing protein [Planctomycetota bacterium]
MNRGWTSEELWAVVPSGAAPRVADCVRAVPLVGVRRDGFMGRRFLVSASDRLAPVNEDELLSGFRQRPGRHPWIGEHAGKWLHAACWTAALTKDAELRAKIERVARGLLWCQEADGYLGTYTTAHRFGLEEGYDWDVWVHKYALIGLLSYYRLTGDRDAIDASLRLAHLLVATFGRGRKSILSAGTHVGMAATSILQPLVLLYRFTGEGRFLDFAHDIVERWSEPGGPDILRALERGCGVHEVANGKAYEMLSNLVGLLELYRQTGEPRFLVAPRAAFDDIVAHRRYLTGGMSVRELFVAAGCEPRDPASNIAETCVTVTWLELCRELLTLTGEARFADEIERAALNHLLAAQRPTGEAWCYYTPLEGRKPYDDAITCCLSSGPRGVALLPWSALGEGPDGVRIHLYEPGLYRLDDGPQGERWIEIGTDYPYDGTVHVRVRGKGVVTQRLGFRVPAWASSWRIEREGVGGERLATKMERGYAIVSAELREGDALRLAFSLEPVVHEGCNESAGRVWITAGPLVYGLSQRLNPWCTHPERAAVVTRRAELEIADLPEGLAEAPAQKALRAMGTMLNEAGNPAGPARTMWLTDFAHTGTRRETFEMGLLELS